MTVDEGGRALVYSCAMGVRDSRRFVGLDDPDDPDDEEHDSGALAGDTVRPDFDVERYAEDVLGRERYATITDEVVTEQARLASVLMDSYPPEPAPPASTERDEVGRGAGDAELASMTDDEQIAFLRARLSPMSRVPSLTRSIAELGSVIEDSKTAYLLGFVDGLLPLETIVDVAGLPELDTLKILDRAVEQYLVTLRPGSTPDRF